MRRIRYVRTLSLLTVFMLPLAACSSNQDARNLAKVTALNANSIRAQISDFKVTNERAAKIESRRLSEFKISLIKQETNLEEILESKERAARVVKDKRASGKDKDPQSDVVYLYNDFKRFAAATATSRRSVAAQGRKFQAEVSAGQHLLVLPNADLKAVINKLAVLGKNESLADRIAFLTSFAKQVKTAVAAAKNDAEDELAEMEVESLSQ